jgi:hypothetical protein
MRPRQLGTGPEAHARLDGAPQPPRRPAGVASKPMEAGDETVGLTALHVLINSISFQQFLLAP